ncbi:peroxiredoxin-like family protein [Flavobacterium lacisediminis]|uniref:thioredoxin-dependent peroxiredoxin n=1 Tax=Flavobacterium lacisediminis TaxID=2989705 RepID=A0ABT3EDI7_9FLAO|nr:peroxiredoxin-like family protein [Flavobacterium lacisediminis]MCW1146637.1 AhpC/TSA family protein [Flavobacterium lacisediminis]
MKKILSVILFCFTIVSFGQIADKPENVSPLLIGEKIPNVLLRDVNGNEIHTDKILSKKTVIIVYRGGWCPYCNSQLADMQEIEDDILALGYQVVAVSPDAPSFLKQTLDKKELHYQLYSDSEGVFSKAVGIAFQREKPKLDKYSEGKNPGFLPVPTVYVINDNKEIEFLYINPNYSKRLEGKVLLAVLKSL